MTQKLSSSATFQTLQTRVQALEQINPLPATMGNNSYLSSKRQDGMSTRIVGITPGNDLYFGGMDTQLHSVVITTGSSTSLELKSDGISAAGILTATNELHSPTILAQSINGLGGTIKIMGSGVAGYTGIVQFHKLDGTRNGYIGFNPEAGAIQYGSDTGAGHAFTGGPLVSASPISTSNSRIAVTPASGPAFLVVASGGADRGYFATDDTHNVFINAYSGNMQFQFAGGTAATMSPGGVLSLGDAVFGFNYNGGTPYIVFDNNDIVTFDRAANKYYFVIGGVNVASIDASGNMRLKGTLTQSVTP